MKNSTIKYRLAVPEDVSEVVPLIYASGPDAFDYVFKNERYTAQGFLQSAFVTPGGEFSYDNHTVMLKDGKIVGAGSVFSGSQAKSFTLVELMKILKYYKWNAVPILRRGLKIERIIQLPKRNEWAVAHIAIIPTERGRGLGQQLIEYLMQQVAPGQNQSFILDVSELNPRAKALYERMGFKVTVHRLSDLKSDYGFVVNHYRMELKNQE